MKNQYFGDINDYRKYGLLRLLTDGGSTRTVVCWMLTGSDGRNDGSRVSYLESPERWRMYNPGLFDLLRESLHRHRGRNVRIAEERKFIPCAIYFSKIIPDDINGRADYFAGLFKTVQGNDLVFFDPDNGIEVASTKYGKKGSSKYIYWDEISKTYGAGYSVLIYQHFPRVVREKLIEAKRKEFRKRLGNVGLILFATSGVLFILAMQKGHRRAFKRQAKRVATLWKWQIRVIME
jgi:hypothetical protein